MIGESCWKEEWKTYQDMAGVRAQDAGMTRQGLPPLHSWIRESISFSIVYVSTITQRKWLFRLLSVQAE